MPERLTGRNHRIIPCLCRVTLLRVYLVHGTHHTAPQVGRVSGHGVVLRRRGAPRDRSDRASWSCMSFFEEAFLVQVVYRHPEITISSNPSPPLLPASPNIIIKSQNTTLLAPHLRIRLVLQLDQPQGSNAACGFRLLALAIPRMGNRCRTIFFFLIQDPRKKKGGSVV